MPSYRITVPLGRLAPGVDPAVVLPAVADRVSQTATVEATDVSVVRSTARITVRFGAEDDATAETIARSALARSLELAAVAGSATLTRRVRSVWEPVCAL
ncbi:hypothetical protein [Marisediminicola sp. LYQ134]|uniref:hypothetical protein n=1 Tax=Marisediminicola sp. LYQ134 TaxID=3391061 RepID=UPI0039838919